LATTQPTVARSVSFFALVILTSSFAIRKFLPCG
jgi:hypothetical protein